MALRHDLCVFGNSDTYSHCRLARDRGRESGCWFSMRKALAQSQELVTQLKSEGVEYGANAASELNAAIYFILFCTC